MTDKKNARSAEKNEKRRLDKKKERRLDKKEERRLDKKNARPAEKKEEHRLDKKEARRSARRAYKEAHQPAGVFQVRNLRSGKLLLASSPNLPAMFNRMKMQLDTGSYLMHPELQGDWQALGEEAFAFEVLEELTPPDSPGWNPRDDLAALLELLLEKTQPYGDKGYNRPPRTAP